MRHILRLITMASVLMLVACTTATPTALPTAVVKVEVLPTNTPAPTATSAPTLEPTATTEVPTEVPASAATATTAPAAATLNIALPANIRSGPGTNYPILGGLQPGSQPNVTGRDSTSTWFVIDYNGQQGWVSNQVASYSGDVNTLAVITAPPPPRATSTPIIPTSPPATAVPPTAPPATGRFTGSLQLCSSMGGRTSFGLNERICFIETLRNNSGRDIAYGIAGVNAVGPITQFQTSWSGTLMLRNGCTGPTDTCGGPWEDGIRIATAGTYRLTLQVCYSLKDDCSLAQADWETLSAPIQITVQ